MDSLYFSAKQHFEHFPTLTTYYGLVSDRTELDTAANQSYLISSLKPAVLKEEIMVIVN